MTMRVGGDIPTDDLLINLDIFNSKSYPGSGTSIYNVARSQYTGIHTITGTGYVLEDGIPTIECDGSDVITSAAGGPVLGAEYNYYSFCKLLTDVGVWRTLFRTTTNDHPLLIQTGGLLGMYDNEGGGAFRTSGYNMDDHDNTWLSICANAHDGVTDFYINGEFIGDSDDTAEGNTHDRIGNYSALTQSWGWVSQALLYNRQLTTDEIKDIHNTFRSRYGI